GFRGDVHGLQGFRDVGQVGLDALEGVFQRVAEQVRLVHALRRHRLLQQLRQLGVVAVEVGNRFRQGVGGQALGVLDAFVGQGADGQAGSEGEGKGAGNGVHGEASDGKGAYTLFSCKWEYIAFDQEKWI